MQATGPHCPFLNRSDERCGDHFRLDHLHHAYKYCFDRYAACPVYLELLVERRVRRNTSTGVSHEPQITPVQVTVRRRNHQPLAAGAPVSA
ncbi:MAG: hypothetical protein IT447_06520 [Phycisphaerales bacterium]|nr:hypothetical protein [Phycisphaerales bacterium]